MANDLASSVHPTLTGVYKEVSNSHKTIRAVVGTVRETVSNHPIGQPAEYDVSNIFRHDVHLILARGVTALEKSKPCRKKKERRNVRLQTFLFYWMT